jgi:hypothetical protein
LKGLNPLAEFSFDPDDFDGRDFYDFSRDERREQDRIDEMRRNDALEAFLRDAERDREQEAIREVVNNDAITFTTAQVDAINDPTMKMDRQGNVRRVSKRATSPSGRKVIRGSGQFTNRGIPLKRTRKKTKTDKTMSKCLKIANKKFRKANGQLRKGKTMRDVMRHAHRLCRKEK